MSQKYWLERAWLGTPGATSEKASDHVLVTVEDGRFTTVQAGVSEPPPDALRLAGLTIPGLANCHSHAFHRALRGRTQQGRGSFWTWREQMYAVAGGLTPDSYYDLARATYREMAVAGITSVGEFHYLHHGPDGAAYDEPNVMGLALIEAARDAGLRITLLDTCYLAAGIGSPPEGVQVRYSDGDVHAWRRRADDLTATVGRTYRSHDVVVGGAIHSVRAVPSEQIPHVADWASYHAAPLHAHLSEQVAENETCLAAYGLTPTKLLEDAGVLGPGTSVVHATHVTDEDIALLGRSASFVVLCPTTERDLGDGIGPSRSFLRAGSPLTLGSDSHAVVDLFEEMRAVEMDERLATHERGHWSAAELLRAATFDGHRCLGFHDGGSIAVGFHADLVTLDASSPRTAGAGGGAESAVFAATAADVVRVMADGKVVATRDDRPDIGAALDAAIVRCLAEP